MLNKLLVLLVLLLCPIVTLAVDMNADPDALSPYVKVFGENNTIYYSRGGNVDDFVSAAKDVLKTGRHVRINGWCASACAIFADKARPNVCITDKAIFGFHMMLTTTKEFVLSTGPSSRVELHVISRDQVEPISKDIKKWVKDNGGFPYGDPLRMNSKKARAFWPMCK